jgi:ATP-binding cassette subfamily F protein 3
MLTISQLTKSYGGQELFSQGNFFIGPGEKVGLVGPNGAGKTSLFRLIMKEERPDQGSIQAPDSFKIAYFSQSVGEMKGESVLDTVIHGNKALKKLKERLSILEQKCSDPNIDPDEMEKVLNEMGDVQTQFEQLGGYDIEFRAQEILTGLGISPDLHSAPIDSFSGGWKMRVALAQVLAQNPDLVLLDEPTNYLDLESILWLEEWIKNFKGAIFMTSHDRHFMNGIVKKIIEVNHKKVTVFSGNYDFYEKEKVIRREQLQASFERQQQMLSKEEEFIARFAARASHAAQVQSRVKKIDKIDKIELPAEDQEINFTFPIPPRSGNEVVTMENLAKSWFKPSGEEKVVFKDVTGVIRRLEKVAVVGVNGAGKSTLLKIMSGQTESSSGKCEIGASVSVGYFSQFSLEVLDPKKTVIEELRGRVKEKNDGYLRNLLAAFLFRGDDVEKKISVLSGGEKSRLILAGLMSQNHNLLILDEPTNHLDLASREVLLKALKEFEGTVIMVSHDRYFLRELSSKVLEVSKGGVLYFPGDFDYYLEKKKA